jgi:hypothetical protein
MQPRNWSGYGLKAATWEYKSARYCAFHAALLHFVDRSLVGEKGPAGYRTISSPHWRSSVCTGAALGTEHPSHSVHWEAFIYAHWVNSDKEHFWYRRWGSANCTGLTDCWGCMCDVANRRHKIGILLRGYAVWSQLSPCSTHLLLPSRKRKPKDH